MTAPGAAGLPLGALARRAWVPGLIGWVLGTGAQTLQAALWSRTAYAVFAGVAGVLAALVWRWRRQPAVAVWGWMVIAAALAFALTGWRALDSLQQRLPDAWDGAEVSAVWQITGLPQHGSDGTVFEARLLRAHALDGKPLALTGTVRVGFWRGAGGTDGAVVRVQPGEVWRSHLRLRAPRGLANPYGFDAEAWLWREGVVATARVLEGARRPWPTRLNDDPWAFPLERARAAVRDAIVTRVEPGVGAAAAGLVAALVTGDQAAIPDADWQVIRATGVAHLVAISGVHVTMFAWLAVAVVGGGWRRLGRRWPRLLLACPVPVAAGVGGVALAATYALFAGWGMPAQRTVTMVAVVVGLSLTGRRWPWPVTWLLAMAAALLIDPWAWWQPGFWLSFVAVAVLFAQGAGGLPAVGWAARLQHVLREGWRAQLVVTVALAPLTLLLFGQVSVVGLAANAVAIPWVTWALTPIALLGVLAAPLWNIAGELAQGLLGVLHTLAAWPGAVWERPALPMPLALLACAGALVLVGPLPWRWRAWGVILLWPAWTFQPPAPAHGTFEVLLPDVGQGSAVIVRTAHHTLVFDAGPPLGRGDAADRVLLPWLRALGVRPDAVVISHDDSDHAAGMATLARAYPHMGWWASFDPGARVAARVRACVAGEAWEWDGVRFAFVHPPTPDWGGDGRGGDNARSCVLRIGEGTASALLTGDIRREEEARLIAAGAAQPVGLLVAAHHGSGTSTSAAWLDALRPQAVAIQAGWCNRYGHPHPQVVRRLYERGIAWVNTATCGAVIWHSAQPRRLRCERQERRRYVDAGAPLVTGGAAGAGDAGAP